MMHCCWEEREGRVRVDGIRVGKGGSEGEGSG